MDPFEEFEFKPLTDGLGFQKRKSKVNSLTGAAKEMVGELSLTTPLPIADGKKQGGAKLPKPMRPAADVEAVEELVRSFKRPQMPEITESPATLNFSSAQTQFPQAWELMPFIIDLMIVSAVSLVCLIISLVVTKVDFVTILLHQDTEPMFYLTLPAMFMGLGIVYTLVTRIFMGATLGELIFDLQTGTDDDHESAFFPFRIMARVVLVFLTGLLILPFLSLILRKDLAGEFTKTPLMRKS